MATRYFDASVLEGFRSESRDMLSAFEQGLLVLETPGIDVAQCVGDLFRTAHNLKGCAKMAGFTEAGEVCHVTEELLHRLRDGRLAPTKARVEWLLRALDAMREAIDAGFAEVDQEHATTSSAAATATAAAAPGPAHTIRVELTKLQRAVDIVGELGVAYGRIEYLFAHPDAATVTERLDAVREGDQLVGEVRELIVGLRLVPLEPALRGFERSVRDVAQSSKKAARLVVDAAGTEVDALLVDKLRDPLNHMVRNAVDHGLEPSDARAEAGKDPCGTIRLSARRVGGHLVIEVADDGKGLARDDIKKKLRARGVADPDGLSDDELFATIFEPGFSTSKTITEISGRGVGMDVVRTNVEALGGTVSIQSEAGRGTTFRLTLPQVVGMVRGLRVSVGDETLVLPASDVIECVQRRGTGGVLELRGAAIPLVRLRELLSVDAAAPRHEAVVVVRHAGESVGLVVDEVYGERSMLVKALGPLFGRADWVSGGTMVGTGRIGLVLDVPRLVVAARSVTKKELLHVS